MNRSLLRSQILDGAGVMLLHSALLVLVLWHGQLWRYLLFWLVLERVIGAIVQARGLLEHHGLWRDHGGHLLTQLYATRNVAARGWLNALMGGLPHHSAHHAFPWIPTPRLPEATARITAVLASHGLLALPAADSYGAALRERVQDKEDGIPNNLAQSRQRSHRPRPLNRV